MHSKPPRWCSKCHSLTCSPQACGTVSHLFINVRCQVAHIQIGGVGVSVVEGACAVVLHFDALLAPQPLPLLARLLLPSQPPRRARHSIAVSPMLVVRLLDPMLVLTSPHRYIVLKEAFPFFSSARPNAMSVIMHDQKSKFLHCYHHQSFQLEAF